MSKAAELVGENWWVNVGVDVSVRTFNSLCGAFGHSGCHESGTSKENVHTALRRIKQRLIVRGAAGCVNR